MPCRSSSDCTPRQCCVSNVRPIGRKKRSIALGGTCQPLGGSGDGCLVRNEGKNITGIFFESCRCQNGLTCVANGGFDIPLGPTGTCGSKVYG